MKILHKSFQYFPNKHKKFHGKMTSFGLQKSYKTNYKNYFYFQKIVEKLPKFLIFKRNLHLPSTHQLKPPMMAHAFHTLHYEWALCVTAPKVFSFARFNCNLGLQTWYWLDFILAIFGTNLTQFFHGFQRLFISKYVLSINFHRNQL